MAMKYDEIYLVPYAHLDSQWRWEFPTTIAVYLKRTLEDNFALLAKYPDYCFNFTGALRYAMMQEYYPALYERLKDYVRHGRWHIAGTSLEETDALIPSPESLVRNILYGDQWFKRALGKSSRDYMLPDCFGFPASMPTILTHCGIQGFSTQKLSWGSAVGIPFEVGMWRGPDGSELACALNPGAYVSYMLLPPQLNPARLKRLYKLGSRTGVWKSFQYYGEGDIGGAPTEGSVRRAGTHFRLLDYLIKVRQGAAEDFFLRLTADEKARLARYQGDFLLTNHSAGSLTSAAIMKRWNRKNELLAFAAEAAAMSALLYAGSPYPTEKISAAWRRVIGSQMHDILPGTCTPSAYPYSYNDEVIALNTWTSVLEDAAQAIAPILKAPAATGAEVLLYNPCASERRETVEFVLPPDLPHGGLCAVDPDGQRFPCQLAQNATGAPTAVFAPHLPPLGWGRFVLSPDAAALADTPAVRILREGPDYLLQNQAYRVRITPDGVIASIVYDGRELLQRPLAYELQKERPAQFPAWNMDWRDRKKPPFARITGGGSVAILEEGPLRCTLRIRYTHGKSEFVKDVSLDQGDAAVAFTERIAWRESGCSLKLALGLNLTNPTLTTNWQTCRVARGVNHAKCFEVPSQLWADMSQPDGFGVALLEDSKYGYDRPDSDTLRLTLLYTPALWYVNGFWDQKSQDWGEHTIRYALYAHTDGWRSVDAQAQRFNQPVRAFALASTGQVNVKVKGSPLSPDPLSPSGERGLEAARRSAAPCAAHGPLPHGRGEEGWEIGGEPLTLPLPWLSLCRTSTPQIGVLALKHSEDGDGLVVRLAEKYGQALPEGYLEFPAKVLEAREVNGLEEDLGPAEASGGRCRVSLPANGVKAYRIRLAEDGGPAETPQTPLQLPHDARMITANGEEGSRALSFPAELVPPIITAGAVRFVLAKGQAHDCVICAGQTLDLPRGYRSLHLLFTAEADCRARLRWLDNSGAVRGDDDILAPSLSGFIGQWDTRQWLREPTHFRSFSRDYAWINRCTGIRPGYIKRQRLEWFSTHLHKHGQDQPYQFGYLFSAHLRIPEGAVRIALPEDRRLLLFALTASQEPCPAISAQSLGDRYDY